MKVSTLFPFSYCDPLNRMTNGNSRRLVSIQRQEFLIISNFTPSIMWHRRIYYRRLYFINGVRAAQLNMLDFEGGIFRKNDNGEGC